MVLAVIGLTPHALLSMFRTASALVPVVGNTESGEPGLDWVNGVSTNGSMDDGSL